MRIKGDYARGIKCDIEKRNILIGFQINESLRIADKTHQWEKEVTKREKEK